MIKDKAQTKKIIELIPQDINICIYDIQTKTYFGKNMLRAMYPASTFKIFIGARILDYIEKGIMSFDQSILINSESWESGISIFPNDINKRLHNGDYWTIDDLLKLMLRQSDNTASHTLLSLIGVESIESLLREYNFEITHFTDQYKESVILNTSIKKNEIIESSAYDMIEAMRLIYDRDFVSVFVSDKLEYYLKYEYKQMKRKGLFLSNYLDYYGKGGFLTANLWSLNKIVSLCRNLFFKGYGCTTYYNDACYIKGGNSEYILCVMSKNVTIFSNQGHNLTGVAEKIYFYMENNH